MWMRCRRGIKFREQEKRTSVFFNDAIVFYTTVAVRLSSETGPLDGMMRFRSRN